MIRVTCTAAFLIMWLAPGGGLAQDIHPDQNLVPGSQDAIVVKAEDGARAAPRVIEALVNFEVSRDIGSLDGPINTIFGNIEDIKTGGDGSIWTLDGRLNQVRKYKGGSAPIFSFGRPGHGPLEFMRPEALAILSNGEIAVLDPGRLEIKFFSIQDTTAEHLKTVRHGIPMASMCGMGSDVYIRGVPPVGERDKYSRNTSVAFEEIPSVVVYNRDAGKIAQFGDVYETDDPALRLQLTEGPIACFAESESIIASMGGTSFIYAYSARGQRKWVAKLDGLKPTVVEKTDRATTFRSGSQPNDRVLSIVNLGGGYALIQSRHRTPKVAKEGKLYEYLDSFVIDVESGEGTHIGNELPLIYEYDAGTAYSYSTVPYPKLSILNSED